MNSSPALSPTSNTESERPLSVGFNTQTQNDAAFNATFKHQFTTIDGVQMHAVVGGHGPQVLVLLHGWPHSWYVYREIMPALLPGRTVIAVDLPGMGDSTGQPTSMARATLATYIHKLLEQLGHHENVHIVAHDFGVGVAYALAAQYRQQVAGLFLMDYVLPGKNVKAANLESLLWHFSFNKQNPLAEDLVTDRVETYLTYFLQSSKTGEAEPVSEQELSEIIRVYSRPQVLRAGFELYRVWSQDESDNAQFQLSPLTIPVRLITQTGFTQFMLQALQDAAPDATGTEITGAGHYLVHEAPNRVLAEIDAFYPANQ